MNTPFSPAVVYPDSDGMPMADALRERLRALGIDPDTV